MNFIKNNLRIFIAVGVAIVLIIVGIIIVATSPKQEVTKPNNDRQLEEKLEEVTGMSKEEAIDIIKEYFKSDNYEFEVVVTNDSLYKITAINTETKEEVIYYVDPTNGMAYIDIDTN